MFNHITLEKMAVFHQLDWPQHQRINLIIGENDTGKTHLLKILYCLARSLEEYNKTDKRPPRSWQEILANKLLWTFQPPDWRLNQLIEKGQQWLKVAARFDKQNIHFVLQEKTTTIAEISELTDLLFPEFNTLFIPPKEILTAFDAIAATREQLEIAGFDDCYFDLIKALRLPITRGEIQDNWQQILKKLDNLMIDGQIRFDKQRFIFKRGNTQYAMSETAEGIKKLAIFNLLIRNRKIKNGTIIFIDEPEVNLHPKAIVGLVEMLFHAARAGIQIYIATHSYFVLKRFELLARQYDEKIPVCSLSRTQTADFYDLRDGMPPNPIIDVSIELYEQDVKLDIEL
jgi:AAA15 family ATPase/GTPase